MPLVMLLRGANVGGHRTFRPTLLVERLRRFHMVNIGAAGTFVVWRAPSRKELRAAVSRALPMATEIVLCAGRDIRRLADDHPFGTSPPRRDVVRFVSFLAGRQRQRPELPLRIPPNDEWLVRILGATDRCVFGEYRHHMRTIRHLGEVDRLFGVPATTRNWNTVRAIVRALDAPPQAAARAPDRSARGGRAGPNVVPKRPGR